MSDRVPATLTIAPRDEDQLKQSEDGRELLSLIESWGFHEYNTYPLNPNPGDVVSVELVDYEANYGTYAFSQDEQLMGLLKRLNLWRSLSDSGSVEWGPSRTIYTPDGKEYTFDTLVDGSTMMPQTTYQQLWDKGGQAAIEEYWRLGNLSYNLVSFMEYYQELKSSSSME